MQTNDPVNCFNCGKVKMNFIKCAENVTLDQCPECGGIWLDKGELHELKELGNFYIKNLDNSLKKNIEKNRIMECPRCNIVLEPVKLNTNIDIKIDRFSGCKGHWLDRGELIKLSGLK